MLSVLYRLGRNTVIVKIDPQVFAVVSVDHQLNSGHLLL
jgi:hypothetical protein